MRLGMPPRATARRSCRQRTPSFPPIARFRRHWSDWSRLSAALWKYRALAGLIQLSPCLWPAFEYGEQFDENLAPGGCSGGDIAIARKAQTTLRIGLAEDPDILDPSIARTYVGRIVFASFCDKLFDIDDKLNIVPQLALSHETSADGKEVTIKLRPGVKFHDGEAFDAEAAKFSLERHLTMTGSFRKPELAAVDRVEVVDPLTIRIVVEKFADYWNKSNVAIDRIIYLPIVDATVRLANLKSGGLDLIERVLAT